MKDRVRLGTVTITDQEKQMVADVLDSGFVSPGKLTKQFENEIAEVHGKKYGLALNSGQSALMVALEAASKVRKISRKVAVPAITYISSFSAIIQAGLMPHLVDVEPTPEARIKWEDIPSKITCALPCHLFGRANDNIAYDTRFIIEDACESIYAPAIGFGDALCLSFYPSHTITAGFGGMILTDNEDYYFKCWQLVNHGRQDWDDYTTCHTLKERFTFNDIGYSLKFSDLNAALGIAQHNNRGFILDIRKINAKFLLNNLQKFDDLHLPNPYNHTFMMFPIIVRSGRRDALELALNDANIETRRMMPITTQPIVRELIGHHNCDVNYPNANYINNHGLYIGCHQEMTEEHLSRIINVITKFYK